SLASLIDLRNRRAALARSQDCFRHFGLNRVGLVRRQRNGRQDADDRDHDHQFDQGKTLLDTLHGFLSFGEQGGLAPPRLNAVAMPADRRSPRAQGWALVHAGYTWSAVLCRPPAATGDVSRHIRNTRGGSYSI